MSNWLSKAANAFKGEKPETPQPFEILCECQQKHTGLRRQRFQNIICKSCGTSLFVLPRDVYPIPLEPVQRESPRIPLHVSEDAETEDELTIRPAGESSPKKVFQPQGPAPLPKPRPTQRQRRKMAEQAERERELAEMERVNRPNVLSGVFSNLGAWASQKLHDTWVGFRDFWTPLRLLFVGLTAAVVLATALMVSQVRTSQAEQLVREHGASGMKAVADAEWAAARKDLQLAVTALDRLQREDPEAQAMRQYYRETHAMLSLCDVTLFELIDIARQQQGGQEDQRWRDDFRSRFRNEWMVFEGQVIQTASRHKDQPARFELRIPWVPGGHGESVVVSADFPALEEVVRTGAAKAIFAGQLAACERIDGTWRVELNPHTGFLWTHPATYRELGMGSDPQHPAQDVDAQLAAQAKAIGEVKP